MGSPFEAPSVRPAERAKLVESIMEPTVMSPFGPTEIVSFGNRWLVLLSALDEPWIRMVVSRAVWAPDTLA